MRQHLYISSSILILFISIIFLNDYSVKCAGSGLSQQYLEFQKFAIEKLSLEYGSEFNPWEEAIQSDKATLPGETRIHKNIIISGLFLYKTLSNPSLIDLPPPAPLI